MKLTKDDIDFLESLEIEIPHSEQGKRIFEYLRSGKILEDQDKAEKWDNDITCHTCNENKKLKEEVEFYKKVIDPKEYMMLCLSKLDAEHYAQKLDEIDKLTLHAGCMGNPDCLMCPIQKILRRKDKHD